MSGVEVLWKIFGLYVFQLQDNAVATMQSFQSISVPLLDSSLFPLLAMMYGSGTSCRQPMLLVWHKSELQDSVLCHSSV